jgi:GNAT superfamily N-acetyltransferase
MKAHIREAIIDDIPALVAMGLSFIRGSNYRHFVAENPRQLSALAAQMIANPDAVILLAERDGVALGMIGVIAYDHFVSGTRIAGEIMFWTDPAARGLGLRLLRAAEAWATGRGAEAMHMISPDPRVDTLYERMGYRAVERTFQRNLQRVH